MGINLTPTESRILNFIRMVRTVKGEKRLVEFTRHEDGSISKKILPELWKSSNLSELVDIQTSRVHYLKLEFRRADSQ